MKQKNFLVGLHVQFPAYHLQIPDNLTSYWQHLPIINGNINYIHNPSRATQFQLIRNEVQT